MKLYFDPARAILLIEYTGTVSTRALYEMDGVIEQTLPYYAGLRAIVDFSGVRDFIHEPLRCPGS